MIFMEEDVGYCPRCQHYSRDGYICLRDECGWMWIEECEREEE